MNKAAAIICLVITLAGQAGAATGTWTGVEMNWTQPDFNSFSPQYNSGDAAQFLDAGAGTVYIDIGGVTPGGVTVNASGNYTFTGGGIGGSGSLTKSGTGTLVLQQTNTYTGTTTINAGTIVLDGGVKVNNGSQWYLWGNSSLVLTNGARLTADGSQMLGWSVSGNRMFVAGGTGTSTFNGNGTFMIVGDARGNGINQDNLLVVSAGGVVTNVTYLAVGESSEYQTANAYYNSMVVTNGGKVFISADLRVGVADASGSDNGSSVSNTVLIADGGVVRANGIVYVGGTYIGDINNNGSHRGNSMTIINGGKLYSGGAVSFIGRVQSTYASTKANNNNVTIAGSLNGTNAMWDLGGKDLFVGYTTTSIATGNLFEVNTGGVATNIGTLTVSENNSLTAGRGGQIYASAITNAGALTVIFEESAEPNCGSLNVTGNLDISGATLNIITNGFSRGKEHVIANCGSLTGRFAVTNGLPDKWRIEYTSTSINVAPPPYGTVIIVR